MRVATLSLVLLSAVAVSRADVSNLQDALTGLPSTDPTIYVQAVKYLTKHSQQAQSPLLNMFHTSADPLARLRAVKLLGDFDDKAAMGDLQQVLMSHDESNTAVRVEIIRSLAKLGDSSTLVEYLGKRQEDSPSVSAAIAVGLQGKTDDDSKKALSSLLRDEHERVSRAALTAISKTYGLKLSPGATETAEVESAQTKTPPSPGDQAILQALQATQSSKDPQTGRQSTEYFRQLSRRYKSQ